MSARDSVRDLLDRLEKVRRTSNGWSACCPAHDDRHPSLTVSVGEGGRLLVRCMAGCSTPDVLAAVGLSMADLFADNPNTPRLIRCPTPRRPRPVQPPSVDLLPHARRWHAATDRTPLVDTLGVSVDALDRLRVGRASSSALARLGNARRSAWSFPMRDHIGRVIGVRLRYDDGSKRAVVGSRQGLFVPAVLPMTPPVLFVVEGASDTAALLTLDVLGVGLPSAGQGADTLALLLNDIRPGRVLLIADADEPGRRGMHTVAGRLAELGHDCRVTDPPAEHEDVRDYLLAGGCGAGLFALLDAAPDREVMR